MTVDDVGGRLRHVEGGRAAGVRSGRGRPRRYRGGRASRLLHPQRTDHLRGARPVRSEEHTSELQSLMRISYAVFCLKKKKHTKTTNKNTDGAKTHNK